MKSNKARAAIFIIFLNFLSFIFYHLLFIFFIHLTHVDILKYIGPFLITDLRLPFILILRCSLSRSDCFETTEMKILKLNFIAKCARKHHAWKKRINNSHATNYCHTCEKRSANLC